MELARASALLGDRAECERWLDEVANEPENRFVPLFTRTRCAVWFDDRPAANALLTELAEIDEVTRANGPVTLIENLLKAFLDGVEGMVALDFDAIAETGGLRRRVYFRQLEAELASAAGERDHALTALEQAVKNGLLDIVWLKACPPLQALRGDPRFDTARAIVERRSSQISDAWLQILPHIA